MTDDERYECAHDIEEADALRGGTRQYPDGLYAFLTAVFGEGSGEERVTLYSKDRTGLAAALRRVADEIENVSPFNLPPVLMTGDEWQRQQEGK